MVRCKRLLFMFLALMILFLAACSSNNEEQSETDIQSSGSIQAGETEGTKAEKVEKEVESVDNTEEVSFEVNQVKEAPEDQGDSEVRLEGEFQIDNKFVSVKGMTNLLPESKLVLSIESEYGLLVGGIDRTEVNENGEFELEYILPDEVEGIVHIELKFEPANQYGEIKNHYLNQLGGSFVRNYAKSNEIYQKVSFQQSATIDGGQHNFSITEPSWDLPEDYGNPKVWIEPVIEKQDDYVVVKINSNIIEDTFILARADIPNYITSGFQGYSYTDPDGSTVLYIHDPEKDSRIKNLTEYDIVITMDPSHHNNGPHVTEVYGENGQNLAGDFVNDEDETKVVEQTITITVEE